MQWLPAILILPYLFILLKIYRSLLKIKPFVFTGSPTSFVSVIVACHNEQGNLPILLKNIIEQDYPTSLFEVIIVDDNSTDRTLEIAQSLKGQTNLISLNNNGTGKKQAIRTGIEASSGKLIITTDADCRMGRSWIRSISGFYESFKPDMIICPVQIEQGCGFFRIFQELEFLSLQGITAGTVTSGKSTMCNGANLAFTRKAYLDNETSLHFEISSGDDIFFLHSLKKQKQSKILWLESRDAIVTTGSVGNVGAYLKQRRRWISKAGKYSDADSILLGIVTFVTISLQICLLALALINQLFLPVFLTVLLLKSAVDFLILRNTCYRYGRKKLMNWFLAAQIFYPIYVLGVVCYSQCKIFSSPSPKET
jgi:glycosyltransferase involved in cell wall biosynthesis